MKSEQFNFNSKKTSLRGKKEKQPGANNSKNWDRIVYLAILGALVLAIVYYLVTGYYVVDGKGRVMVNQYTIRAPHDLSVTEFFKEAGDSVKQGDSLFTYNYLSNGSAIGSDSLDLIENVNRQRDRLTDVQEKLALKREELQSLRNKLKYYQEQKQVVEKEVRLNVETADRLREIEEQIMEIEADINTVQHELKFSYQRQNRIQQSISRLNSRMPKLVSSDPSSPSRNVYKSPYRGKVSNNYRDPLELAMKSEEIVSIQRDSARILVKALFERDDAEHLTKGQELAIRFDNGEPSRGIISDMYVAETDLMPVFNLTGFEASEKMVVEVKPLNKNVRQQWQTLSGMGLTAQKTLF